MAWQQYGLSIALGSLSIILIAVSVWLFSRTLLPSAPIEFSFVSLPSPSQSSLRTSINRGSAEDLETLPGVGPATAQKIIDHRPYQSLEELVSKKAMGRSLFEKLKEQLAL